MCDVFHLLRGDTGSVCELQGKGVSGRLSASLSCNTLCALCHVQGNTVIIRYYITQVSGRTYDEIAI